MTNDITAEEYDIAFKVAMHAGHELDAAAYALSADRLRKQQARDTEAEELAEIGWDAAQGESVGSPSGLELQLWKDLPENYQREQITATRAILDHLAKEDLAIAAAARVTAEWLIAEAAWMASRRAPDNGITLTADEAADVRWLLSKLPPGFFGMKKNAARLARIRARFAPTEQAEPKPIPLPTEPGARIKASVRRWPGALTWADEDPHVGEFTLEADGSTWSDDEIGVVRGCFDHITVLEVLPAEKPEPRSWTSLDQVPHDVTAVYSSNGVSYRRSAAGWEYLASAGVWRSAIGLGSSFTEVVGGVL